MDSFSAYDEVLKRYELEEEIIITYEIEAEKAGFTKNYDLSYNEINELKNRVTKVVFNQVLNEVQSNK
ncbi:MAG: hypothetical protein ACFFEN_04835 [Candidatus Thorarchaeota archaeon]